MTGFEPFPRPIRGTMLLNFGDVTETLEFNKPWTFTWIRTRVAEILAVTQVSQPEPFQLIDYLTRYIVFHPSNLFSEFKIILASSKFFMNFFPPLLQMSRLH